MSPEQNALRVRVGAVTLGSMLLTVVALTVLLVVSDIRASRPDIPQERSPSSMSDGITSFAVDTLPAVRAVVGSECAHTAYVVRSKTGTEVFVYTRNADGVVTDPD